MGELTDTTEKLIDIFFLGADKQVVIDIMKSDCGNNLPFCEKFTPKKLERIRFAVIKYSEGQIDKFCDAIELAKIDWRDLLVAADFAKNSDLHRVWAKSIIKNKIKSVPK